MFLTYKQYLKIVSWVKTEEEFKKVDQDYHNSVKKFLTKKKQFIISILEQKIKSDDPKKFDIDLKGINVSDLNGLKTTNDYDEYILNAFGWFEN